ncbi:MAG: LemA family protein [Acidimicrobiales bacterium]|nr:MAG: LemA family protein [Acidimicrobiales bacterium]
MTPVVVLLVVLVIVAVVLVAMYNGLVRLRNQVDSAWAHVDVQLRRRYDLIPNLVETVKGYAAHERETLEAVIQARNRAMAAGSPKEQAEAENIFAGAIRGLLALSESYPELKANENFENLQKELSDTESKVAYARQYYNDIVAKYNTRIQTFPTVMVAGMFGFRPREYFEAEGDSRGPVVVDF